jgi:hypothetical protein
MPTVKSGGKRPKQVHYLLVFRTWKRKISLIIFGIVYLWAFFFVPDVVIQWIAGRVGVAKSFAGYLFAAIASASVVWTFLRIVIGDPLLKGNFTASKFFKGEFPSVKIATDLGLDPPEARQLFVDYYDTWQFDTEVHHQKYLATTRDAGFECRAIFLLSRLLYALLILGAAIIATTIARDGLGSPAAMGQLTVWGLLFAVAFVLTVVNRLPSAKNPEPTGCWAEWRRRCEENYSTFRSDLAELANDDVREFGSIVRAKLEGLKRQSCE